MTKKLSDIVITSALRTPIGTYRGSLKELNADKLGSISIKEVIKNSKLLLGWSYFQLFITSALMFMIFFKIPILSKSMILLLGGLLAIHVMAYTLLLDGKKVAIVLEGVKFVFGMVLFTMLNERIGFVSNFSLNLILSYLFTSLGMTIYFFWTEIKSQQVIASVES